jgi:SH3-like domain-containing protein
MKKSSTAELDAGKKSMGEGMPNLEYRTLVKVALLAVLCAGFLFSAHRPVMAEKISPYFVSLKADKVNVRKGAGRDYDILWTYRSTGLPVEVIAEHEHWRRIRDSEGSEGWVHFRLISRLRFALVAPWDKTNKTYELHQRASSNSAISARLEPGVKLFVKSCSSEWCEVTVGDIKGWIEGKRLWGVYPGEVIK